VTPGISGRLAGWLRPRATEKDAVKCTGDGWQDAWYLAVDAEVEPAAVAPLLDRIAALPKARQ
jgi:tetraacyldisaccharide-1-P 4'-kinase